MGIWRNELKKRATKLARKNKWPIIKTHDYILPPNYSYKALWKPLRGKVTDLKINWHSLGNLTSSQYLAVDVILGLFHVNGESILFEGEGSSKQLKFEWKDPENYLREKKRTNIDCMVKLKEASWLFEFKYAEDTPQPCKTSLKNEVCFENSTRWLEECPLIEKYGTKYMSVIRDPDGPINMNKFSEGTIGCPMRESEWFQLQRLVSLAWIKSSDSPKKWYSAIVFPQGNIFIEKEVNAFRTCLRNKELLFPIKLEELVAKALKQPHTEGWAKYIENRYLHL